MYQLTRISKLLGLFPSLSQLDVRIQEYYRSTIFQHSEQEYQSLASLPSSVLTNTADERLQICPSPLTFSWQNRGRHLSPALPQPKQELGCRRIPGPAFQDDLVAVLQERLGHVAWYGGEQVALQLALE